MATEGLLRRGDRKPRPQERCPGPKKRGCPGPGGQPSVQVMLTPAVPCAGHGVWGSGPARQASYPQVGGALLGDQLPASSSTFPARSAGAAGQSRVEVLALALSLFFLRSGVQTRPARQDSRSAPAGWGTSERLPNLSEPRVRPLPPSAALGKTRA